VAAGQKSTGNTIKLQAGSVLKIHLDDPLQLLIQKTKTGLPPHLSLGFYTPQKALLPTHVTAMSVTGRDYSVTVPLDTQLVFSIQSFSLKLADAAGNAVAASGGQSSFQHATTDANPVSFAYKITGLLP